MSLGTTLAKTAQKMLAQFGTPVAYTFVARGSYDPVTGSSSVDETTTTVQILTEKFSAYQIANNIATVNDVKLHCAALDLTPRIGDYAVIDGKRIRIVSVSPQRIGTDIVTYEMKGTAQ